jgi:hypothetical protein
MLRAPGTPHNVTGSARFRLHGWPVTQVSSRGDDLLLSAVLHLVGQSRAFLHQAEAALDEISSLRDERTERLVEALQLTTANPARPGTLRHLELAASALLHVLRDSGE